MNFWICWIFAIEPLRILKTRKPTNPFQKEKIHKSENRKFKDPFNNPESLIFVLIKHQQIRNKPKNGGGILGMDAIIFRSLTILNINSYVLLLALHSCRAWAVHGNAMGTGVLMGWLGRGPDRGLPQHWVRRIFRRSEHRTVPCGALRMTDSSLIPIDPHLVVFQQSVD